MTWRQFSARTGRRLSEPCARATVVADNHPMAKTIPPLTAEQIKHAIEVAWDDRPPFNRVLRECGLSHGQVVQLLKRELTSNAFKAWNARIRTAPGQPAPAHGGNRPR